VVVQAKQESTILARPARSLCCKICSRELKLVTTGACLCERGNTEPRYRRARLTKAVYQARWPDGRQRQREG